MRTGGADPRLHELLNGGFGAGSSFQQTRSSVLDVMDSASAPVPKASVQLPGCVRSIVLGNEKEHKTDVGPH